MSRYFIGEEIIFIFSSVLVESVPMLKWVPFVTSLHFATLLFSLSYSCNLVHCLQFTFLLLPFITSLSFFSHLSPVFLSFFFHLSPLFPFSPIYHLSFLLLPFITSLSFFSHLTPLFLSFFSHLSPLFPSSSIIHVRITVEAAESR
jgi:hypothetical protein